MQKKERIFWPIPLTLILLGGIFLIVAACAKPTSTPPPAALPTVPPTMPPTAPPTNPPAPPPAAPPTVPPTMPTAAPPTNPPTMPTAAPPTNPPTTPPTTVPVQGPNEVWVITMQFRPDVLTVPVGTTVTWTNKDSEAHTVTGDTDPLFGSLAPLGGTFSYTFNSIGVYGYRCDPHPDMTGRVIVN